MYVCVHVHLHTCIEVDRQVGNIALFWTVRTGRASLLELQPGRWIFPFPLKR